jgi:hypothetical protein
MSLREIILACSLQGERFYEHIQECVLWQVVKKLWDYIKANDLQNPKDRRKIIMDDKLKTIFKPPLTMLNMNKQLSKHVFVGGEILATVLPDHVSSQANHG